MVSQFERFAVRSPIPASGRPPKRGSQSRPVVFLPSPQIPEAEMNVELSWINGIGDSVWPMSEQELDRDQILLHIGMDHRRPQVLGATVELGLGGQPIVFNSTTAIFIPRGTLYGPLSHKEFQRPHIQLRIVLGSGDPCGVASPGGGSGERAEGIPKETRDFDYEQYVVRSPVREAGPDYVEGRQNPTMTYLSGTQIRGMSHYMEFGWIWDVPSRPIPKMRHDNFDELVLHIGSDPDEPEDLGATLEFGFGEELLEFDTTHCGYLPRSVTHGPIIWKEVHRPMIEFAMMIGASTWAEGWEGSFFEEPKGTPGGPK